MRILCWYKSNGIFWFKIFGHGLVFVNRDIHKPLFSIRNGIKKELRLGRFGVHCAQREFGFGNKKLERK